MVPMTSMAAGQVNGQVFGHVTSLMGRKADDSLPCAPHADPPGLARPLAATDGDMLGLLARGRGRQVLQAFFWLPRGRARGARVRPGAVDVVAGSEAVP